MVGEQKPGGEPKTLQLSSENRTGASASGRLRAGL